MERIARRSPEKSKVALRLQKSRRGKRRRMTRTRQDTAEQNAVNFLDYEEED